MLNRFSFQVRGVSFLTGCAVALVLAGCSSSGDGGSGEGTDLGNIDNNPTIGDLDSLIEGAPNKADLPEEGKADAVYPAQFFDLLATQSPIRNQASRGVCSIFASIGHMEHLYIAEGTILDPDFSEEFLQWSTKVELGEFAHTEGSSSRENLLAINRYGVVEEKFWPYVGRRWTVSDDPACEGDKNVPVRCYTHGDPPAEAMNAKRWKVPAGRWINTNERSIKAFMYSKKQGVEVGGTFYYQAWNHRSSELPVNSAYFSEGYVTTPNAEDRQQSLEKRGGHAFLLVGWDDNLEVQKRDGQGKMLTDADGNPVTEKGFFIFKNSWGSGSFGTRNPHGAGYGYISYEYVAELNGYVSGLPEVQIPKEICNDNIDNDGDGDIDCDDADCKHHPACAESSRSFSASPNVTIPDNDPEGVSSVIEVDEDATISGLAVTVDITHLYVGDITVKLVHETHGEVMLLNREGGYNQATKRTFAVSAFNGKTMKGKWRLVVADHDALAQGTLYSWALDFDTCSGTNCAKPATTYKNDVSKDIPDGAKTGVFSNIVVDEGGPIKSLKVYVDIEHPEQMDLTIKLQRVGSPKEVFLMQAMDSDGPFEARDYVVNAFLGDDAKGTWRLTVIDEVAPDSGTLRGWNLQIGR